MPKAESLPPKATKKKHNNWTPTKPHEYISGWNYFFFFFCSSCTFMCWNIHCSTFNKSCFKSKRLIIFGCFSRVFVSFISQDEHVESTIQFFAARFDGYTTHSSSLRVKRYVCDANTCHRLYNHQVNLEYFAQRMAECWKKSQGKSAS